MTKNKQPMQSRGDMGCIHILHKDIGKFGGQMLQSKVLSDIILQVLAKHLNRLSLQGETVNYRGHVIDVVETANKKYKHISRRRPTLIGVFHALQGFARQSQNKTREISNPRIPLQSAGSESGIRLFIALVFSLSLA
jgi:hypothetical protein